MAKTTHDLISIEAINYRSFNGLQAVFIGCTIPRFQFLLSN